MEASPARPKSSARWWWWVATVVLGAAVVVDVIDGNPLKLATSALLFVACLLSALVQPPRSGTAGGLVVASLLGAIGLVVYRALGPGL